jgi:hypothetical protein
MKGDLLGAAAGNGRTAIMASPRILAHALSLEAVAVSVAVGVAANVLASNAVVGRVTDTFLDNAKSAVVAIV